MNNTLLIDSLKEAIKECREHNTEYKYVTAPEKIASWEVAIAAMTDVSDRKDKLWNGELLPDEKHISKKELVSSEIRDKVPELLPGELRSDINDIIHRHYDNLKSPRPGSVTAEIYKIIEPHLSAKKPGFVSLEKCVLAYCNKRRDQVRIHNIGIEELKDDIEYRKYEECVKSILNAAGVDYDQ